MWKTPTPPFEQRADERSLVRRMLAGDERAFDEFFAAYFQPLYRFSLTRLDGNVDLAKEMAQAALCTGFEKLSTFRGEAPLFSWLCTICRYEISAHFRRLQRRPIEVDLPEESSLGRATLDTISERRDDPERAILRAEVGRLVHVTIDNLPVRYRQVLAWKYVEGLSVIEIAQRLELSAKAAESLLTRARSTFRDGYRGLIAATQPASTDAAAQHAGGLS